MKIHELSERRFLIAFDKDDDLLGELSGLLADREIQGARLEGIGAFSGCRLGFFQRDRREYDQIVIDEQVELTSLLGNAGRDESGAVKIHLHATVSRVDGSAIGGHLLHAEVWPTVEMFVEILERPLIRHIDEETGLPLLT